MYLAGHADAANATALAVTWWLRDAAGILVVAPVVVLWALTTFPRFNLDKVLASAIALVAATLVGLVAFSPLVEQSANRSALGFLAVPLLWAALRCGPRDAATTALILAGFAVWGALAGERPFAGTALDQSFFPLIMFRDRRFAAEHRAQRGCGAAPAARSQVAPAGADLRAMFSQAGVGIAQMDAGGRFNFVNNRSCEIVRHPAPRLLQMCIHDLTDPADQSHLRDLLARATDIGEGSAVETRSVQSDGSRLWIRSNVVAILDHKGAVRHLMAVVEDVTTRRRAEENLRRAYDDLQKTLNERSATLEQTTEVLHTEIEQRKRVEAALKHDIAERRKAQEAPWKANGAFAW